MAKKINKQAMESTARMLKKRSEFALEQLRMTNPAEAQRVEQVQKLFEDAEFAKAFLAASPKQAAAFFGEKGVSVTEEEAAAIANRSRSLNDKLIENDGELSEEDLEQASGGMVIIITPELCFLPSASSVNGSLLIDSDKL